MCSTVLLYLQQTQHDDNCNQPYSTYTKNNCILYTFFKYMNFMLQIWNVIRSLQMKPTTQYISPQNWIVKKAKKSIIFVEMQTNEGRKSNVIWVHRVLIFFCKLLHLLFLLEYTATEQDYCCHPTCSKHALYCKHSLDIKYKITFYSFTYII